MATEFRTAYDPDIKREHMETLELLVGRHVTITIIDSSTDDQPEPLDDGTVEKIATTDNTISLTFISTQGHQSRSITATPDSEVKITSGTGEDLVAEITTPYTEDEQARSVTTRIAVLEIEDSWPAINGPAWLDAPQY